MQGLTGHERDYCGLCGWEIRWGLTILQLGCCGGEEEEDWQEGHGEDGGGDVIFVSE